VTSGKASSGARTGVRRLRWALAALGASALVAVGAASAAALGGAPSVGLPTTTTCGTDTPPFGAGNFGNKCGHKPTPPKPTLPGDSTPPDILGDLPDLHVEATGPNGAAVDYGSPAGYDNQDGDVGVSCVAPSGSTFPLGATLVTCSAADAAGNVTRRTFTVTVVDTTPPTLNLPSAVVEHSWFRTGRHILFTALATDLVDGSETVACSPPNGSVLPTGSRVKVVCTATDAHGNTATGSFFATVVFGR
jgi:hypothetical protein